MSIHTVSLVGLGALGILFGHKLAGCPDCRLRVIADEDRAARYRAEGVTCNGETCEFDYVSPAEKQPADLVIFAVKSTQLESAIRDAAGQVGPDTVLISLLNGISSEQRLEEIWPGQVVYAVAQGMDATRMVGAGNAQQDQRTRRDVDQTAGQQHDIDRAGAEQEAPQHDLHLRTVTVQHDHQLHCDILVLQRFGKDLAQVVFVSPRLFAVIHLAIYLFEFVLQFILVAVFVHDD